MAKVNILVSTVTILRVRVANLPAFVEELASVLHEHYPNYEVLLIDNGSAADTDNVVRQLLSKHTCVR